ncbi:MAG TPA: hypothetical protein VJW51_10505, partial [Candidatus Acidoferrales bacterium]|nr:hypothetical protein [Candidatus Acidoferrales bacterium]
MKITRYSRYTGEPADAVDLEDLVNQLSDYLLQSGFESPYSRWGEFDPERSMESLRQAILQALEDGELLSKELLDELMNNPQRKKELERMLDRLVDRLSREGFISPQPPMVTEAGQKAPRGQAGRDDKTRVRFEITDKTIDFLGFRALKDLMSSLGKSSLGRHDTHDLSTGVEATAASKPYEFGDTINMDIAATLFNAVQRNGPGLPIELDYSDLRVHQCDYQSSCATVILLDCSHSMILYGEDRFTPAKRVSLALSHLIRTQYPGDSLHLVLFHDSAE